MRLTVVMATAEASYFLSTLEKLFSSGALQETAAESESGSAMQRNGRKGRGDRCKSLLLPRDVVSIIQTVFSQRAAYLYLNTNDPNQKLEPNAVVSFFLNIFFPSPLQVSPQRKEKSAFCDSRRSCICYQQTEHIPTGHVTNTSGSVSSASLSAPSSCI